MNSPVIQLLILAGIAVFLILRLRSVLGTREGFEKPPGQVAEAAPRRRRQDFEVIEGGPDPDIVDFVDEDSDTAKALAEMKKVDPEFSVHDFVGGARGAYEMILMAFERGELAGVKPYLGAEVYEAFASVVEDREAKGLTVEATFVGLSEVSIKDAIFDDTTREAELTVRFKSELTSIVRDRAGEVIEGNANEIRRQRDSWTFARTMGSDDPNWLLVATGD